MAGKDTECVVELMSFLKPEQYQGMVLFHSSGEIHHAYLVSVYAFPLASPTPQFPSMPLCQRLAACICPNPCSLCLTTDETLPRLRAVESPTSAWKLSMWASQKDL